MITSILINIIRNNLGRNEYISFEEIFSLVKNLEPNITEMNLRFRLHYLRKQNKITPIFQNIYTIFVKNNYYPIIGKELLRINKIILKEFEKIDICFAETRWLNEFSVQQAFSSNVICMTEEYFAESIFRLLLSKGYRAIFYPEEKDVNFYLSENEYEIITKLITRSPTFFYNNIRVPKLEKLLTDAFIDKNIYFAYQGYEMEKIFSNADNKYNINFSEMLNYARRRGKYKELNNYLKEIFPKYQKFL